MGGSQDLALKVLLQAQDQASGTLKGFGSTLINLAGDAGPLLKVFGGISLAAIGMAAACVSAAAPFQQSMLKNQALAGLTQDQYTKMSNAILDLAPQVGQAPKDLADGLYYVLSAGIPASQAMEALSYSAKLAATGMTDTQTTANALTNVMKVFGVSSKQAADIITKAVSDGKMTMEQYANSIGKLSLTAKGYNVSIYETNAALDTLTNNGFPSAAQASTGLANFLSIIDGRTDTVAKRAAKLGISFDEQKFKTLNLAQQVQYLNEKFKGHTDQIQYVLGGSKQASQAFQALSGDTAGYNKALSDMKTASNGAGAANQSFQTTQQGLNQQIAQAKAAVDALGIKIGLALIPVITQLVSYIAPAINAFMSWADAVSKNEVAMAFIKGALVGFVAIVLMLLIPAFIAWAIAAWNAAVATLAATWPILLIGAIIAAVVAGIILAVQHWGQIVDWLKMVWGKVAGFFEMLWAGILIGLRAVGQFFVNVWSAITTGVGNFFSLLGTLVHNGMMAVLNFFLAPFRAVGALFEWLYQHNRYFQALVDSIRYIVQSGLNWLHEQWSRFTGWITGLWSNLKNLASNAWNAVKTAVMNAVLALGTWEIQQWNKAIGWLSDKWNSLKDIMGKVWGAVSGVISSAWNTYIAGPIGNIWNNIKNWFDGLATQALQWGKNLIQGFINGIMNMASNVGNAVKNIASTVGNFLGFHSPAKQGPGAEADKWAPNLISMFSSGLKAGQPQIQAALNAAISPLAIMNSKSSPAGLPLASGYGRPPLSSSYNNYAGGGNHYGNNSIIIQGAGQNPDAIANAVMQKLNSKYRRSGSMGNSSYGVRNS